MSIRDQINSDLKDAMRSQQKHVVMTLRGITAAIKQIEVDERIEVDEGRMLVILDKLAKQRNESISQYQSANRVDLVEQEQFELEIIKKYLPEPLSEDEILRLVTESIAEVAAESMRDMNKVIANLKPKMQGRVDMSKVSVIIKQKLN